MTEFSSFQLAKQVDNENQTARGAKAKPKGDRDTVSPLLSSPDCPKDCWNSEKPSKCPQRKRYEAEEYRGKLGTTETRLTCAEALGGKAWC